MSETCAGVVLSWNPAAEEMFGYTAKEAIGQHMEVRIPADRMEEAQHLLELCKAGGYVEDFETVRVRKDGSRFDVSLTASPIWDEGGTFIDCSRVV